MRAFLFLLPVVLMAQVPGKVQPAKAQNPKPSAVKSAPLKRAVPKAAVAKRKAAMNPQLTTDDDKTIYSLGLSIFKSLSQFDLSASELEIVKRALSDAAAGKPAIDLNEWGPKIKPLAQARAAKGTDLEKAASRAYLDKAAAEPGAVRTASGLVYREVKAGSGAGPKATDTVKVHYRGTLVNGTEFDSSYARNEPAELALNAVVRCWTEGVQRMAPGGKALLVCPSDLAYGDSGRPGIPGGAALIFEIELLEVAAPAP